MKSQAFAMPTLSIKHMHVEVISTPVRYGSSSEVVIYTRVKLIVISFFVLEGSPMEAQNALAKKHNHHTNSQS